MSYDHSIKITLIGNTGTGKTSLFNKLCYSNCPENPPLTIGVDFGMTTAGDLKLQVWDTAGHEKFRAITKTYYKNVAFILLVFSLNNRKTFIDLDYWMQDIMRHAHNNTEIILIGNKNDLDKQVSDVDIQNFIFRHAISEYFELSCINDISNVCENIKNYIRITICEKISTNSKDDEVPLIGVSKNKLKDEVGIKTKKLCCVIN